ncbi:archaeal proteasome endopeptidase complex subunit alpha [Candidatus Aciduliprofundum boonei]|uniref:Proteasome subunit alpha n=1 Tax=Aciduliprofundum boonei (strain DSM 19572 / T469) TaxID=439481 RepID=B5IEK1_ACIB4|nr:archaeal proteasome endopeptidase complex subunit alpha [Candidatus Aciduliprofundum boonei]ADD07997.1 proteasome endopeptidase complex, alpha subunit [Aciduliprofundum boonei T469]EDY34265.1 peptidase, T1 family [Aciduliprofundum boonei T469]EDY35393.1 peptidase, T1 family [Aciduliprofundum boonei T469]HII55134.1 archaeal proteasome endopeptidase complex subunit alpha [Candidatus Aciduliprofundum boonei]
MQPAQMAYDRAITVFSPDGRLFQVEYARAAVKRGTTTIGLKFKDGVVLMADKRVRSRLLDPKSMEKIFLIDEHIGCATSGLVGDARVLVDYARLIAQIERVTYGERISVEHLVKRISDYKQQYTQYGGVRPFGASLLIAGIDEKGIYLMETDPSGTIMGYKADCIGGGRDTVMELFENEYREDMDFEEAIMLGLKGIDAVSEDGITPLTLEIGYIRNGGQFTIMSEEEVAKYLEKYKSEKKEE